MHVTTDRTAVGSIEPLRSVGLNLRPLAEGTGLCRQILRTGDVNVIDESGARLLHEGYDIRTYFDLRTASERKCYGNAATLNAAGILTVEVPVSASSSRAIAGRRPSSDAYAIYYMGLLDDMTPSLPRLFTFIAALDGAPFMFGCHAGKDRTGIVAMLLLDTCGADSNTIAGDYEKSADYLLPHLFRFRDKWELKGETSEDYATRLNPRGETMHKVILNLNKVYGSISGYLTQCGVAEEYRKTVRDQYGVNSFKGGAQ